MILTPDAVARFDVLTQAAVMRCAAKRVLFKLKLITIIF